MVSHSVQGSPRGERLPAHVSDHLSDVADVVTTVTKGIWLLCAGSYLACRCIFWMHSKTAKISVTKAKYLTYEDMYDKLNTRDQDRVGIT